MNQRHFITSSWLATSAGLFLLLAVSGCGGGGGGDKPSSTSTKIKSVLSDGTAIPIAVGEPWRAQYLNGHRVVCGVFGGQPGVYVDSLFKAMPQTIPGATKYVPLFMAGKIVYGSYQTGNFSWNTTTNSVAATGDKQAVAVSPNGLYVAFQTAGTGSVLNVSTNTEFALPVIAINAVSDSGSGVCEVSGNTFYRFTTAGAVAKNALNGANSSQSFTIQAANANGLLAGQFGGLPGIWQPSSTKPLQLGMPGGSNGVAETMNLGGAVGGWYKAGSSSSTFALLWPTGNKTPNVFVDVNGQFPLSGGAVLNAIYALDPNSLNFIGLVTSASGAQSIQAFSVH